MGSPSDTGLGNKDLKDRKKNSLPSNSSSYSFLELPWSYNEVQMAENAEYLDKFRRPSEKQVGVGNGNAEPVTEPQKEDAVSTGKKNVKNVHFADPLFYPYDLAVPLVLKRFIKNPPFRFTFKDSRFLDIVENQAIKIRMEVIDFKELEDRVEKATKIALVINRNRFRQRLVAEENRSYRDAIAQNTEYERSQDKFKQISKVAMVYQARNRINFLSIDNREDLLRELKCITKSLSAKTEYVPKVKTFTENRKEFLCYLLAMAPGISKNVAAALSERFGSLCLLVAFLKQDKKKELKDIEVWNDDKSQVRELGEKQVLLLRKFLLGEAESCKNG